MTGPSHAGRPPPSRGDQTVRAAPPGRLGARIPPARPTPGRGAPRGDRLTGATLARTPGRPLLPAAPRSPARASSRQARRVRPRPPVTAPSPGGARGAGRGGRTWRAPRWPAARRGVSRRGPAGEGGPAQLPGLRARDPPRQHPRVGGPGPPPPGAGRQPQLAAPLRTPALLPPPYGNLQPQKVTRRRFLGLSARPPPPGQRSCRGDSGRGSGFLGQNLLGRLGRARGGGRARNHCPDFFFIKKNLPVSFPPPSPGKLGGRAGDRSPVGRGPRAEADPLRAPCSWGAQASAGRPSTLAPSFPREARRARDGNALWRTRRPAGGFPARREPAASAWGPGPLQARVPAHLTFPRAETRGSGRAPHRVAHAFPAGSPEEPCRPLRCSRRRSPPPPPPPPSPAAAAAAASQITTRRV